MEEEKKDITSENKVALAVKVKDLLEKESGGDDETMIFAIKTAASLLWSTNYKSRGVDL